MTCLGIRDVGVTCLVAVDVEKVTSLNFVFAQRFSSALRIPLPPTRFMLQDEFNIQTRTHGDSVNVCAQGFMFCLQQLACIFSIIALLVGSEDIEEASQLLNCLSDMTQHKTEMDKRDGKFGAPLVMEVPPVQQMSHIDQPMPPQVGYPPPPPYGQPPGFPPPPPVYGPPRGYPPPPPMYGQPPGCPSPPQPHPHGYPPATYPPQGYGYPPANYPAHPPPDYSR
ncbi:PLAC8 family protein [Abeliophyllum distichum]|uniref:PLAC8 family protein n=1 Tax=Abeliophyllum distichum TaxID=126358 RepID=A0ABD1RQA3_9LAMI